MMFHHGMGSRSRGVITTRNTHLFKTETYSMCSCMWICSCLSIYTYLFGSLIYSFVYSTYLSVSLCLIWFNHLSIFRTCLCLVFFSTIAETAQQHRAPQQQPSGEEVELGVGVGPASNHFIFQFFSSLVVHAMPISNLSPKFKSGKEKQLML